MKIDQNMKMIFLLTLVVIFALVYKVYDKSSRIKELEDENEEISYQLDRSKNDLEGCKGQFVEAINQQMKLGEKVDILNNNLSLCQARVNNIDFQNAMNNILRK